MNRSEGLEKCAEGQTRELIRWGPELNLGGIRKGQGACMGGSVIKSQRGKKTTKTEQYLRGSLGRNLLEGRRTIGGVREK